MEETKPATLTAAAAAPAMTQIPATTTVAPVVLPNPPAAVPAPASDKK